MKIKFWKKGNRFYEFHQTWIHRKVVQELACEKGFSFPFHDLVKMINILILGDKMATKLHRRFSSHHEHNGDIQSKVEAVFDWESARFTKPEKKLNAFQTWKAFYSHIPMEETLRSLGYWEE